MHHDVEIRVLSDLFAKLETNRLGGGGGDFMGHRNLLATSFSPTISLFFGKMAAEVSRNNCVKQH